MFGFGNKQDPEAGTGVTIWLGLDDDDAIDALCDALAKVAVNQVDDENDEPHDPQPRRRLFGFF